MKKIRLILSGIPIGFINSFFGSGGGIIAVPVLKNTGLNQKEAQATAVSVILPLTIITAIIYYFEGKLYFSEAVPYMTTGFFASVAGSFILNKISNKLLQMLFALFMIWAGLRMIIK